MARLAPLVALAALLALAVAPIARAQTPGAVREYVRLVYSELADAERRGADVTDAALRLNEALRLVQEAERETNVSRAQDLLSTALSLAEDVRDSIPKLVEEGESRAWWWRVAAVSSAAFVVVGCAVTYLYAPRIVWGLWLRFRRDWRVRRACWTRRSPR